MSKNILIGSVVAALVVGFAGGMYYDKQKTAKTSLGNFTNLSPEERQVRFQQLGGGQGARTRNIDGGSVAGELLSKDNVSVTVKLRDGSTKIVFFSETTSVQKSVSGSLVDLTSGQSVMVTGKQNQDGSVTAQSIQIRPKQQ